MTTLQSQPNHITKSSVMEPLLPNNLSQLFVLGEQLLAHTTALHSQLHPTTREAVKVLVEKLDSYHDGLMHGHNTDLADYLAKEQSSINYITQAYNTIIPKIIRKVTQENGNPFSETFIKWLHMEYFNALPDSFRHIEIPDFGKSILLVGEFRTREKKVGNHTTPYSGNLFLFIEKFEKHYSEYFNKTQSKILRLIAAIAAHHRFIWMQPFQDGNERIANLLLLSCLIRDGWNIDNCWSINMALANKTEWRKAVSEADLFTENGEHLSEDGLHNYVAFVIEKMLTHVKKMKHATMPSRMLQNIAAFIDVMQMKNKLSTDARFVMEQVWLRGSVPRMEMLRITGRSDKTAKKIAEQMIDCALLQTDASSKFSPYKIHLDLKYMPFLFPNLLNHSDELELLRQINAD